MKKDPKITNPDTTSFNLNYKYMGVIIYMLLHYVTYQKIFDKTIIYEYLNISEYID